MEKQFNYQKLRLLRSQKKQSETAFSKLIGVSRSTLRSFEEGKTTPKTDTLQTLCSVTGTTLEDWFEKKTSNYNQIVQEIQQIDEPVAQYKAMLINDIQEELSRIQDSNTNILNKLKLMKKL